MRALGSSARQGGGSVWQRIGSALIMLASLALIGIAVRFHSDSSVWSSSLLRIVLVALAFAIVLHVRFLMLARKEHLLTENALNETEREYKAVFDSALDGILILDSEGICRGSNRAATKLFAVDRGKLLGSSLREYLADDDVFGFRTTPKATPRDEPRETRLLRANGELVVLEYTVRQNFLPGRHVIVLRDVSRRKQAERSLRASEERFQQMGSVIDELFVLLDAEDGKVLYVNKAYEAITGRSCQSFRENPKSFADLIHPEDRLRVLARLAESKQTGLFDEEFRIVRPKGAIRWVWTKGFPVKDSSDRVRRFVGTVQDVTLRKLAEEQMVKNLDLAEAARAEAEAFRKISLALTQNLCMDHVLDTLLQSLLELIPCESAQVILVESETRLFLAREIENCTPRRRLPATPSTFNAKESKFFVDALAAVRGLLITDTREEAGWRLFKGFAHLGSWLCAPLVASERVLGLLSVGHTTPSTLTPDHLRLAKSLAIPAAVAIQNARLYEQAAIFRLELEQRLADLPDSDEPFDRKGNVRLS